MLRRMSKSRSRRHSSLRRGCRLLASILRSTPENMSFCSLQFLIFFPVVTALYFAVPQQTRWALLLVASCIFYMAFVPAYILILAGIIIIDYFAGLAIARAAGRRR